MRVFRSILVVCFILLLDTIILYAQWIQAIGSYSGVIYCFTVNETNIFAGTNAGVFLSTDGGINWSAINNGLTNTTEVESLPFIGTDLFAGTWTDGVFLSTDNGSKWTSINNGLTHTMVSALIVKSDGTGDTNLFAGTWAGGVFISTNKGSSWTAVNNGLTDSNVVSLIVSDTNLFAGTTSGVFLSTNNGSSWSAVNNGLTFTMFPDITSSVISKLAVSSNGTSGTNLFAGTWGGGVFLSTDNGSNWSAINNGLPANQMTLDISSLNVCGTNLFVGTPIGGIYLSTNNGSSWNAVNNGFMNSSVQIIEVIGTNVFAGTNNGIWRRPISEMATGVEENQKQLPTLYFLKQNYPNPFNPSTTITYTISKRENVLLKIVDILGRDVGTLVNEQKSPGTYTIKWNANNQTSGVYFCKLSAGNYSTVKKLLLMK